MIITTSAELAESLQGFNGEKGFKKKIIKLAKDSKLVIVYAIGNDTIKLCGGITDEFYLVKGGDIFISKDHVKQHEYIDYDGHKVIENAYTEYIPYVRQNESKTRKKINVFWQDDRYFTWKFITMIPHHTFNIIKNNRNFCKAIVFSLNDI